MEMEGGDHISLDTGLPDEITGLTVSAWVTPDFSSGSKIMTIVSQEKGFILGINRSLDPQEHASFAVYDGMEWNSITSNSKINEERTHIAGTFGDGSISLYVNGDLVGTLSDIQTFQINHRGVPEEATLTSISSDSEVTVGAYSKVKKNQLRVSNEFSGMIHVVDLYDKKFDQSQIRELVLAQFDLQEFSKGVDVVAESTQVSIEEESVPVSLGIIPVNEETYEIYKNLHIDQNVAASSENNQVTDEANDEGTEETNDESGIAAFEHAELLLLNGTVDDDTNEEGIEEATDESGITAFEHAELLLLNGTVDDDTNEEGIEEATDESGITAFEHAELLLLNGTVDDDTNEEVTEETTEEDTGETTEVTEETTEESGETTEVTEETTEESKESLSLEEINANLIRISIKYNELLIIRN